MNWIIGTLLVLFSVAGGSWAGGEERANLLDTIGRSVWPAADLLDLAVASGGRGLSRLAAMSASAAGEVGAVGGAGRAKLSRVGKTCAQELPGRSALRSGGNKGDIFVTSVMRESLKGSPWYGRLELPFPDLGMNRFLNSGQRPDSSLPSQHSAAWLSLFSSS